jgi:hypothetical protein
VTTLIEHLQAGDHEAAQPLGNNLQAARYAQRAPRLLREAEELLPEKERETFWQDHVRSDPGLLQLVGTYGR